MKILGIETSCDETAVTILDASGDFAENFEYRVLGNALLSQAAQHAEYGGVFPNLAKREHQRNLVPLLAEALRQADALTLFHAPVDKTLLPDTKEILAREPELYIQLAEFFRHYEKPDIDCIAVTAGPGLEPALWVGINFAKALANAWHLPLVAVNHMEGHVIISALWDRNKNVAPATSYKLQAINFPMLSLLISGGHTELILSREWMHYELVGKTRDDAVGEAFDKVARLLKLPYPGGPEISRLAAEARKAGHGSAIKLPRPMLHDKNFDFSFAGLKTAVLREVDGEELTDEFKKEVAREFEHAVTEVLVDKTMRAVNTYQVRTLIVGGGVSANEYIRNEFSHKLRATNCKLFLSPPEHATDNAIMIALAGYFRALRKEFADPKELKANGNWLLTETSA